MVTVEIVRYSVCFVSLIDSATGPEEYRLTIVHYNNCAVFRLYFSAY